MPSWSRRLPFKVDIGGIIEIMGSSLYSRADTPIREIIQNAHDAIVRRRQRELSYQGRIDIHQDAGQHLLSIHDDGIGLSATDAEEYLSTLGLGLTGLIKKGLADGGGSADLIGQFGIGLFSAFMLADRLVVESRRLQGDEGIRWEAGGGSDILLSSSERAEPGTTVTLHLKPQFHVLAQSSDPLEAAIKEFADFLGVPIYLNGGKARVNVINVAWFEATVEQEPLELALEGYFGETPLAVIPLRLEKPVSLAGALYVTPQRTPGFTSDPVVTVTVRRMVISRRIQGLLPAWASFVRGVLELNDCAPTASREDLVRNESFERVRQTLEAKLFEFFEKLANDDVACWESILNWHRYTLAGAALENRRLRQLLRDNYKLPTSRGPLTFTEILRQSPADSLCEMDAERVIWYNTERLQESWINSLFADHEVPCVHALRSFEESLLASWVGDGNQEGILTDLRPAHPGSPNFAATILGVENLEDAAPEWQEFFGANGAQVRTAEFRSNQPVMAFLNERHELYRTFEEMKKTNQIPAGFQRMIDKHFGELPTTRNEVLLNRSHRLVERVLENKPSHPLASVLRMLVNQALAQAGAVLPRGVQQQQRDDLDWIAEALWGRK